MLMGGLSLVAFFACRKRVGRIAGGLTLLTALTGAGVAGYQVWLQHQPAAMFTCMGGDPNMIERIVDWLGKLSPSLFLATGVCQDTALLVFGYSLAVWALVAFLATAVLGGWALWGSKLHSHSATPPT
jgi:protein dithiol:quinone oxidoreductase